jgi:protein-S-isoprenylcysteine O-methyltransferase Ste14
VNAVQTAVARTPLLVRAGDFSFRRRGLMLPIALLLLFVPSPHLSSNVVLMSCLGVGVALVGQLIRSATVGLDYIIRGGRDHRVYADRLVTGGLYGHCRNPMYVGNFFLILGLALASNSWVFALVGTSLALAMHRAIVAAEEHFLRSKFGSEFNAYSERVPRWVPKLAGLRSTLGAMKFDVRRVLVKEYAKPFDWLGAIALIALFNLWRANQLGAQEWLVALLLAVVGARLGAWLIARRIANSSP